jgi:hypothetical protein
MPDVSLGIYPIDDEHFGYQVQFGNLLIRQEHAPAIDGLVLLTPEQAEALALLVAQRLLDQPTDEERAELDALIRKGIAHDLLGTAAPTPAEMLRAAALSAKGNPALAVEEVQAILEG